jgi:hypothetical protein
MGSRRHSRHDGQRHFEGLRQSWSFAFTAASLVNGTPDNQANRNAGDEPHQRDKYD